MQEMVRSTTLEEFPWGQPFRNLYERGQLQPPEAVIGEVIAFLVGDSRDSFIERQFSTS